MRSGEAAINGPVIPRFNGMYSLGRDLKNLKLGGFLNEGTPNFGLGFRV